MAQMRNPVTNASAGARASVLAAIAVAVVVAVGVAYQEPASHLSWTNRLPRGRSGVSRTRETAQLRPRSPRAHAWGT
jgi:hypothetical protein